jgi:hypothetical protein
MIRISAGTTIWFWDETIETLTEDVELDDTEITVMVMRKIGEHDCFFAKPSDLRMNNGER